MDIGAWLRGLGLEHYEQAFRDNDIDADLLPELTADDLIAIGITSVGHRRRLLAAAAARKTEVSQAPKDGVVEQVPPPSPTTSQSPTEAERRQLTVMFCDLVGSTALSGKLDPEDMREVLGVYHAGVSAEVTRLDGFVAKFMGDGVLAYFGYPQAHEDDAERAIRTALSIIERIAALKPASGTLAVRIGIATGLVVVGDLIGTGESQERGVVGETPNLAARLQAMAEPNGVLIAGATRQLVGDLFEYRDLGLVEIRGFRDPVPVWQVLRPSGVESRFEALHAAALTPLVGREEETDLLLRRWQRTKSGEGQTVLISGEPGIGKSRLMAALHEQLGDEPRIRLRYFCSPHHRDSTLYPFIPQTEHAAGYDREDTSETKLDKLEALLAQSGQLASDTAELFADLLSVPAGRRYPPGPTEPRRRRELTLAALLDQLQILSQQRPVLMMFEDAHWADSTSLELLDHAVERARQLPAMIVITFRPEFAPPWVGQAHVTSMGLSRLAWRETTMLVDRITGGKALPAEILDRILERTDGIPLFVEELTKTLLESALLREEETSYTLTGPLPPLAIPSSLQASLLARLDRLMPVKEVAQIGAALGREFSYELLAAVASHSDATLRAALDQLVESGLVFRRGDPPHATFLFKHALVQDAAYSTLLRSQRQELHARIGRVLEERFPEITAAQPELVAYHFTEAGVPRRAIEWWRRAGERALARSANVEAASHLMNGITAVHTLPAEPERDRLELALSVPLGSATRAVKGQGAPETLREFKRAHELLTVVGALREKIFVLYGLWGAHWVRGEHLDAHSLASEALSLTSGSEYTEIVALANRMMGLTSWAMGKFLEARDYFERIIEVCTANQEFVADLRLVHDHVACTLSYISWTLWPLGYVEQALSASTDGLQRARSVGHAMTLGTVFTARAILIEGFGAVSLTTTGDAHDALAYASEHNFPQYRNWCRIHEGISLARSGNQREAIEIIRSGLAGAEEISAELFNPMHFGHLARMHMELGDFPAALKLITTAIQRAEKTHERHFEAELHRMRGELYLASANPTSAEAAFQVGLRVARRQRARLWELRAAASLARLRRDQGKRSEAHDLLAPVYGWFTEGFDTTDLKEAKALIDELN